MGIAVLAGAELKPSVGIYTYDGNPSLIFIALMQNQKKTRMTMNDLIDRKIAVQGVRELFSMGDCYCDKLSIVGMLNELPSAEPERKWIPVTEALPEKHQRVLVTIKRTDGEMRVRSGNYSDDYFWIDNGDYWKCNEVLAWMSLPEPWRGE